MTASNAGVLQALVVHMADAGVERRVVQHHQRRLLRCRRQCGIEPGQPGIFGPAPGLPGTVQSKPTSRSGPASMA
jgi:hypothetical protein